MAQDDYAIANQAGAAFRTDLNNQLLAIVSNNSGATTPSTTFAYQWWADTTAGLLKIRNAANSAWVTVGTLATTNFGHATLASPTFTGTVTIPTVAIAGGTIAGITDLAIADGGTGQSTAAGAFNAIKQAATASATGVVELADNTEALAGSDTTRAVTSAGLASVLSHSANGYQKIPGGLLIQWGTIAVNADQAGGIGTDYTGAYPLTFPSVVYCLIPSITSSTDFNLNPTWKNTGSLTTATVRVQEYSASAQTTWGISYIAIGK